MSQLNRHSLLSTEPRRCFTARLATGLTALMTAGLLLFDACGQGLTLDQAISRKNPSRSLSPASVSVATAPGSPLGEAIGLVWSTGGHQPWFGQQPVSFDGFGAAQSGEIGDNQESWIGTTARGPGTLSFWWRISSEADFDFLTLSINGQPQASISGEVEWRRQTFNIAGSAQSTIRWTFRKDGSASSGADAAWLDAVTFVLDNIAPNTPPMIVAPPDQTTSSGSPLLAQIDVSDLETPSAELTLGANSSNINLVPNENLSFSSTILASGRVIRTLSVTPLPGRQGSTTITITVTDADGRSATTNFLLTVRPPTPPRIEIQPSSQTVSAGGSATFDVKSTGDPPFNFQWRKDGKNLSDSARVRGSTNASLTIKGVTHEDLGSYSVLIRNPSGEVTSVAAHLSHAPSPFRLIGTWPGHASGPSEGTFASGNYAFHAIGQGGLLVVDITDPVNPKRVAGVNTRYYADGLEYINGYIYTGGDIIDVRNPADPTIVTPEGAYFLPHATVGHYALGMDSSGFRVYDLTDPANPSFVTAASGPINDWRATLAVSGDLAIVASGSNGILVYRVSNPEQPVQLGNLARTAYRIATRGNHAFTTEYGDRLDVIDLASPTNPSLLATLTLPASGSYALEAHGNLLFVGHNAGLSSIDISDPGQPRILDTMPVGSFDHMFIADGLAFLGTGWNGFTVVDSTNPADLKILSRVDTGSLASGVEVSGSTALLAHWAKGLSVIDISDPSSPAALGHFPIPDYARVVSRSGNLAYIQAYSGLWAVDVSNPSNPIQRTRYISLTQVSTLRLAGDHAYLVDTSGFQILDIRDPNSLIRIGAFTNGMPQPSSLTIGNGFAYLVGGGGIQIIDINNPTNPTLSSTHSLQGPGVVATLSGKTLFVADASAGLRILDVSTANSPTQISQYQPGLNMRVRDVAVSGTIAILAAGSTERSTIELLDVADPANPLTLGSYTTKGEPTSLQIIGNHVYVANGSEGLLILAFDPPSDSSPSIIEQPAATAVGVGSQTSLHVVAQGTAPLTYQWQFNSANIPGATNSSLTLTASLSTAGDYRVLVSNPFGSTVSLPAQLRIIRPPEITAHPKSLTLPAGASVTFSASAAGSPPLFYQWEFNGSALPTAINASLTVSQVQASSSGSYRLRVENAAGIALSQPAALTVLRPPRITAHPASLSASIGSTISFSVSLDGDGPFTYQWLLNGANIPNATGPTLTLNSLQLADAGSYGVIAANAAGAASSNPALLDVVGLPSAPPADAFANRIQINGTVRSSNTGATREPGEPEHAAKAGGRSIWFRWVAPAQGVATVNTRGSSFDTLLAIYTGSSLATLSLVTADDDSAGFFASQVTFQTQPGIEYVLAIDGFGASSGEVALSLDFALLPQQTVPRIVVAPQSRSARAGETVGLSVSATDIGPLTYQWFVNGNAIAGATQPTLTLNNVQPAQAGTYDVRVSNQFRSIVSPGAVVEIGSVPAVVSEDKLQDLIAVETPAAQPATSRRAVAFGGSVAAGALGLQVLNNFGATKEQGEPAHAGVIGGASRWFQLRAESDGLMVIDTLGSTIDTVLVVYRGRTLKDLIEVASDNDGASDGIRSRVEFRAARGTNYLVAIDGVNAAQGIIQLNWRLGEPPVIVQRPQGGTAGRGESLTLNVTAAGTTPLGYQWLLEGIEVNGATNASLSLPSLTPGQTGRYEVAVQNLVGTVRTEPVEVTLIEQPPLSLAVLSPGADGSFGLVLTRATPGQVVIEVSTNLVDWQPVTTISVTGGAVEWIDVESSALPLRFYRARLDP